MLIRLLCVLGIVGGAGGLWWYESLTPTEQETADRIAGQYALDLFGKTLAELTSSEADRVHALTKRHFAG